MLWSVDREEATATSSVDSPTTTGKEESGDMLLAGTGDQSDRDPEA